MALFSAPFFLSHNVGGHHDSVCIHVWTAVIGVFDICSDIVYAQMRMNDVDVRLPPRMILSCNTMAFKEDFKGRQTEERRISMMMDDG